MRRARAATVDSSTFVPRKTRPKSGKKRVKKTTKPDTPSTASASSGSEDPPVLVKKRKKKQPLKRTSQVAPAVTGTRRLSAKKKVAKKKSPATGTGTGAAVKKRRPASATRRSRAKSVAGKASPKGTGTGKGKGKGKSMVKPKARPKTLRRVSKKASRPETAPPVRRHTVAAINAKTPAPKSKSKARRPATHARKRSKSVRRPGTASKGKKVVKKKVKVAGGAEKKTKKAVKKVVKTKKPPTHGRSRSKSAVQGDRPKLARAKTVATAAEARRRSANAPSLMDPLLLRRRGSFSGRQSVFSSKDRKSLSLERQRFAAEEIQVMTEEAADWIAQTLERDYGDELFSGFWDRLVTGIELCDLVEKCAPADAPIKLNPNRSAKPGSFYARDNLVKAIDGMKQLGVPPVCLPDPSDVLEGTNRKLIVNSLFHTSRIAIKNGIAPPLIVQYEMEIDRMMKEQADEEYEEEEEEEEEEEDEEEDSGPKFRYLPYEPVAGDKLDEAMALAVNVNQLDIKIKRLRKGEYMLGGPPKVFVRLVRRLLLVRRGGGWEGVIPFIRRRLRETLGGDHHATNLETFRVPAQLAKRLNHPVDPSGEITIVKSDMTSGASEDHVVHTRREVVADYRQRAGPDDPDIDPATADKVIHG